MSSYDKQAYEAVSAWPEVRSATWGGGAVYVRFRSDVGPRRIAQRLAHVANGFNVEAHAHLLDDGASWMTARPGDAPDDVYGRWIETNVTEKPLSPVQRIALSRPPSAADPALLTRLEESAVMAACAPLGFPYTRALRLRGAVAVVNRVPECDAVSITGDGVLVVRTTRPIGAAAVALLGAAVSNGVTLRLGPNPLDFEIRPTDTERTLMMRLGARAPDEAALAVSAFDRACTAAGDINVHVPGAFSSATADGRTRVSFSDGASLESRFETLRRIATHRDVTVYGADVNGEFEILPGDVTIRQPRAPASTPTRAPTQKIRFGPIERK